MCPDNGRPVNGNGLYGVKNQRAPESISSTFYSSLFCAKVLCAAFLLLQFGFLIFWRQNIGAKAACKMLMRLTPGVNFTNPLSKSLKAMAKGDDVSASLTKMCPTLPVHST